MDSKQRLRYVTADSSPAPPRFTDLTCVLLWALPPAEKTPPVQGWVVGYRKPQSQGTVSASPPGDYTCPVTACAKPGSALQSQYRPEYTITWERG